jgi:DNA-binding IclR family transcriptional regulator
VGASGKVILAFTDARERERILDNLTYEPLTSSTIDRREVLEAELDRVREQGYAVSMGERIPGAAGVSVPVCSASGLVMSLSLLGPAERLPAERRSDLTARLQAAARSIEARERAAVSRTAEETAS